MRRSVLSLLLLVSGFTCSPCPDGYIQAPNGGDCFQVRENFKLILNIHFQTIKYKDFFTENYFPQSYDAAETDCNNNYWGGLLASLHSSEVYTIQFNVNLLFCLWRKLMAMFLSVLPNKNRVRRMTSSDQTVVYPERRWTSAWNAREDCASGTMDRRLRTRISLETVCLNIFIIVCYWVISWHGFQITFLNFWKKTIIRRIFRPKRQRWRRMLRGVQQEMDQASSFSFRNEL